MKTATEIQSPHSNRAGASPALQRAFAHATEYLNGLDRQCVGAALSVDELRTRFAKPLPEKPTPASQIIDELVADAAGGLNGSAGGRFFAWVIGSGLESALAADWLTATWDQNAALYACSPVAAVAEEVAGTWLVELLDLPRESSFALTTGCQMAHFTCLAAARYAVLQKAGWDVNERGLCGAPPIRVLVTDQRHGSIDRAARFLGIGNQNIVPLPTNEQGEVDATTFARALGETRGPTIVALDAADLNIAAFDPLRALIPLAKAAGAWVHTDGAFGLFARASRKHRHLIDGAELADSWTTDAHKWLNVPYDCGFAVVRDRAAHRESMTISASYIAAEGRARDEIDWNPEWSRRARGFVLYAALRELGREGLESLVDRCCDFARAIVDGIGALPGAEVLWRPQLNQGLLRFLDRRPGATAADHDRRTDAVIAAINAGGEAFFSSTTWRGKRAMRVSVVSWRTTQQDVERTIAAGAKVLRSE